jgi:poly-gamma-glutamate capsule biosynthesis protein CapA/YwtB (metallophosphatase superfamily)
MTVDIIIGGDFYLSPSQTSGNLITDEVAALFRQSDIKIVNLESPVIVNDNNDKILKTGPHLATDKYVFSQLKALNITAVTLANNHILDYGEKGLATTINSCRQENIITVGAGKNLPEASKPAILESKGLKIAVVNFCENEWSVASNERSGANPLNIIDNLYQIKAARETADFVIAIIHGGHEIYNLPSPRMVKEYRFFAENGADAVIGHHTHCISGFETHNKVPIFYSLGNMLFTKNSPYKGWYTGLVVKLKLEKNKPVTFDLHPVRQSRENFHLSLLSGDSKNGVLAEIEKYSQIINDDNELQNQWKSFVESKSQSINMFSPLTILPGKFPKALNLLGFNRFLLKKSTLTRILNQIRCEAHRDVITSVIQNKLEK